MDALVKFGMTANPSDFKIITDAMKKNSERPHVRVPTITWYLKNDYNFNASEVEVAKAIYMLPLEERTKVMKCKVEDLYHSVCGLINCIDKMRKNKPKVDPKATRAKKKAIKDKKKDDRSYFSRKNE